MAKKGYSAAKISRKLGKIKEGIYSVSEATVLRDLKVINKKRAKWDAIHNPHQMDKFQAEREELIRDLDDLIQSAKKKKQFKTAGELIAKKARLLGVDKYIAPKEKKKDDIEEKYQHKNETEVNDILFSEYRDLSATIMRSAKNGKLNNIKRVTVSILRQDKDGSLRKFFLTRFGEEKEIIREQEKIK